MASVMAVEVEQNGWREIHFKKELVGSGGELDIQLKRGSFDLICFLYQY